MKLFYALMLVALPLGLHADGPWKCSLKSGSYNLKLDMDLYEESVEVPGLEMFGPMHGYIKGDIFGIWMISSCKIVDDKKAELRLSNDLGSETQSAVFTWSTDSTATMELTGTTVIKHVVNKKLEKIEPRLQFKAE